MMRVSVKELLRSFSLLGDKALSEPIIIAKNGRDRLVLISVEEYQRMREREVRNENGPPVHPRRAVSFAVQEELVPNSSRGVGPP